MRWHRKQPTATTIVDDKFGLEYARYRNAENEQRLEQARQHIAPQLLGGLQQESARKEALYGCGLID